MIAVNAHRLVGAQAGVGRYLRNLVRQWVLAGAAPHITLVCPPGHTDPGDDMWSQCRVIRAGPRQRTLIWENLILPRHVQDADVLFCPSYFMPIRCRPPAVVTICDLAHEVSSQGIPLLWLWRLRLGMRFAARKAAALLTISESTKKDICRLYGVDPARVFVTYLAADPIFRPIDTESAQRRVRSALGVRSPYILYVGSLLARRNVPRLIESLLSAPDEFAGYELVLAGRNVQGIRLDAVRSTDPAHPTVRYVGCPSDEDLVHLYNGAQALVYPSSYEGFGLPVIEAMACGTPVVTGNNSSLAEIASGAALLVDVASAHEIKMALSRIVQDARCRAELRDRGLERAAQFSWAKTAADTLAVLGDVGASRSR